MYFRDQEDKQSNKGKHNLSKLCVQRISNVLLLVT
uniref:Uncharacterized protein n=1 Tax=Anguilla anguilla TaxID=7936 RepID=A0A0E9SF97_ANGAN